MWSRVISQPEVTLFGPHDTSRVSESDLHPFSPDGKLDTRMCRALSWWFDILALKQMHLFSELPVKQGVLFSDDEHKMDVDVQKTGGLTASAKIPLFEVEISF